MSDNLISILKDLISHDKWSNAIDYVLAKNTPSANPSYHDESSLINIPLFNGNNLYHIACIKGKTNVIKKILSLKSELRLIPNKLNDDGIQGSHLYYRYGGNDPFLLNLHDTYYVDESNNSLATYLIDNIDLCELMVKNMKHRKCLYSINIRGDDSIYLNILQKVNLTNADSDRYVKLFMNLYSELKPKNIGYILVLTQCTIVTEHLFKSNIDPKIFTDVYNETNMTPLALIVYSEFLELMPKILDYLITNYSN